MKKKEKWAKNLNRHLIKENKKDGREAMKRYPIKYVLNENHSINKLIAKYHYTPIRTTKIQNAGNVKS